MKDTGNGVLRFWKKEPVLCIAAVCALASVALNPPSAAYLNYIDWRVISLLFCLMSVVGGLQECGVFAVLAQRLLAGERRMRFVTLVLVLLPFFISMLVTNDVALITFVPFAVLVLGLIGRTEALIYIVVLQTIAANLGSMATPVGNPQNLYLYANYELTAGQFFAVMLPLSLVSLVGLVIAACVSSRRGSAYPLPTRPGSRRRQAGADGRPVRAVPAVGVPGAGLSRPAGGGAGGHAHLRPTPVSQGGLLPVAYLLLLLPVCRQRGGLPAHP